MTQTTSRIAAIAIALVITAISFQQTVTVPLATETPVSVPALA